LLPSFEGAASNLEAHLVGLYPLPMPEAPRHLGYYDPALLDPFFEEWRIRARETADKVHGAFEHVTGLRHISAEWRKLPEGLEAEPALPHEPPISVRICW
jgi:hypothetical protein